MRVVLTGARELIATREGELCRSTFVRISDEYAVGCSVYNVGLNSTQRMLAPQMLLSGAVHNAIRVRLYHVDLVHPEEHVWL